MVTNRLGRYEILGELGRGAMGVVYRARDPIIDRVVALKTINLALTGAALASFEARFFQEARSAGRLNHPNVVTIYDAGKADGVAYIAMEFLEGTSLREILDEHPPLSVPRILETVAQVARGLAYAHENGVVHRDVKPANIIVTSKAHVAKLCDLGLAKDLAEGGADTDGAGRAMGTPFYISPEQARGEGDTDIRSDLYSLGATYFHAVVGRPPYTGTTPAVIMAKHLTEQLVPVRRIMPACPMGVAAIIEKCLEKSRFDRYQEPAEMLKDLDAVVEGTWKPPFTAAVRRRNRLRKGR
jgi:serine/threonine-protein kinase